MGRAIDVIGGRVSTLIKGVTKPVTNLITPKIPTPAPVAAAAPAPVEDVAPQQQRAAAPRRVARGRRSLIVGQPGSNDRQTRGGIAVNT